MVTMPVKKLVVVVTDDDKQVNKKKRNSTTIAKQKKITETIVIGWEKITERQQQLGRCTYHALVIMVMRQHCLGALDRL